MAQTGYMLLYAWAWRVMCWPQQILTECWQLGRHASQLCLHLGLHLQTACSCSSRGSRLAFLRPPRLQVDSGKALIAKARAEAEQARKHRAELQESCTNVLVSYCLSGWHFHCSPMV